jgi:hypothetical protein
MNIIKSGAYIEKTYTFLEMTRAVGGHRAKSIYIGSSDQFCQSKGHLEGAKNSATVTNLKYSDVFGINAVNDSNRYGTYKLRKMINNAFETVDEKFINLEDIITYSSITCWDR